MNKIISKNIKQILVPVMIKQGFHYAFYSELCKFEKENREGGKIERILIIQCEYPKCIRIEASIVPTYLHMPFVEQKDIMIEDEGIQKTHLNGWSYKTEEDVKRIVEMIKNSLIEKGFEALDAILNDPEDLYPTYLEYRDIYENHEKYLNDFKKKYSFNANDFNEALHVLQKALDDFPDRITEENRALLLPVIAAYGEIFLVNGGKWVWNEKAKKAMITYPDKRMSGESMIVPSAEIYGNIQMQRKENICEMIVKELKAVSSQKK